MNDGETEASRPLSIVVMGVSGCGKSTVGEHLAAALQGRFVDADDLHSQHAKLQMQQGKPLTDAQRQPWLIRVGEALEYHRSRSNTVVMACSALKRQYRDTIRTASNAVYFVHLQLPLARAQERVASRAQHFFPGTLVEDQSAILEPPGKSENDCINIDATLSIESIVESLLLSFSPANLKGGMS
jgi:gluconokinase